MDQKLFVRRLGKGDPVLILHGVFGASDNWVTIGKSLSEKFEVILVDLRNHGQSFHDSQFDYTYMAQDIATYLELERIPKAVLLGHSMGGKVAMQLATDKPENVDKLIIVDIAPRYYPVHHELILQGLDAITLESLQSRAEADQLLSSFVAEADTRQFLLKNLQRTSSGFQWKMNLPVIRDNIERVGEALDESSVFLGPSLFIRGANSQYIEDDDLDQIKMQFPNSSLVTIENAGHWVHAENPKAFLREVQAFLSSRD